MCWGGVACERGQKIPAPATSTATARTYGFDVRDFGADPSGKNKSTAAIRRAIEEAAARGGGTVSFREGHYLTGPIHLKSNITLHVDAGVVIRFSQDFDDYLPMVRSRWEGTEVVNFSPLIYGERLENVAITGRGTLDGQGDAWWRVWDRLEDGFKKTGVYAKDTSWQKEFERQNPKLELPEDPRRLKSSFLRPPFLQLLDSKNVLIEGVTFKNSPFWTLNPVYSDNLRFSGITIINPEDGPNTDGINPESCSNVHISDSHIDVGDDCITIKSGRDAQARRIAKPAENYTITNCTMRRGHGGVVIGSEMSGSVRKITISNSVFDGTDRGIRLKSTRGRGGVVEEIRVSNIVMKNIRHEAITLNLYYQDSPDEPLSERTPRFRNIHVDGMTGHARKAALLLGLPEAPLENISFSDVNLVAERGLEIKDARDVRLSNVRVDTQGGPALVAQNTEQLDVLGFSTSTPHAGTPVIELGNVRRAYVHGCFAAPGTDAFVSVLGAQSEAIVIEGNNFAAAKAAVRTSKQAPAPIRTQDTGGGPGSPVSVIQPVAAP